MKNYCLLFASFLILMVSSCVKSDDEIKAEIPSDGSTKFVAKINSSSLESIEKSLKVTETEDKKMYDLTAWVYHNNTKLNVKDFNISYNIADNKLSGEVVVTLLPGVVVVGENYDLYILSNAGTSLKDQPVYPETVDKLKEIIYSDVLFSKNSNGTVNIGARGEIKGLPSVLHTTFNSVDNVVTTVKQSLKRVYSRLSLTVNNGSTPVDVAGCVVNITDAVSGALVFNNGVHKDGMTYNGAFSHAMTGIVTGEPDNKESVGYVFNSSREININISYKELTKSVKLTPKANKSYNINVVKITDGTDVVTSLELTISEYEYEEIEIDLDNVSSVIDITNTPGVTYNKKTKTFSVSSLENGITMKYKGSSSYVLSSSDWITATNLPSVNNATDKSVIFNIDAMLEKSSPRTATITFTTGDPAENEVFTISQRASVPADKDGHLVVGYYTTWGEDYTFSNLRNMPEAVTWVFVSFAKPNMRYVKGSMDITNTGLEFSNRDGNLLKAAIAEVKSRGQKVILSVGGETYWNNPASFDIEFEQVADFIKDFGFSGIDWDFEPDGSFNTIGQPINVDRLINMIKKTRVLLPREDGYLVTTAPAGVGALGGQDNDDLASPYSFSKRADLTGDPMDKTFTSSMDPNYSISLFGFAATGHMIPVLKECGEMIDMIAFQGYNTGAAPNRALMYDAYAYYANTYGFKVAFGMHTHTPGEPWGPYYTYTEEKVLEYTNYVIAGGKHNRAGKGDGTMFWDVSSQSNGVIIGIELATISYNAMNEASPIVSPRVGIASPTPDSKMNRGKDLNISVTVKRVEKLEIYLNGTIIHTNTNIAGDAVTYVHSTVGMNLGNHTIKVVGTGITGDTLEKTVTFIIVAENDLSPYPAWKAQVYPTPSTLVRHKDKLWSNTWYANISDEPGIADVWKRVEL